MRQFLAGSAVMALAVCAAAPALAQETTSNIRGTVTANGAPVAGATVTVVNVPSGTTTTVQTNSDGSFAAQGLRPGGPYTVSVSAAGYTGTQVTDINTIVAQAFELPVVLKPVAEAGGEIVVTASRVKGARNVSYGPAHILDAAKISEVASVNRDIRDLMERDPFATLDNAQSTGRQVSFAGVNPRFNRFTIDGVPITDSFGLNPDALPSRRGPVPLDSIGQFETNVAPYDIREGFFQGGVINATLKSGTNEFHGTGFYTYSSDDLQGDRTRPYLVGTSAGTDASGHVFVPKYKSQDYGATVSGPIIKDRVFFMVSGERVRASLPLSYPNTFNVSQATIDAVTSAAQSRYNVDAGGLVSNNGDKDDRLVGRLDVNIAPTQRFSLTGIYTKDSIVTLGSTSSGNLSTGSDDYVKPNRVLAGVAQLNSDWSSNISTETRFLYKDYQSGQTPLLANTAQATVCSDTAAAGTVTNTANGGTATSCSSNSASIIVGPQGSAQANVLHIKTYEASLVTKATFGDHRIRLLLDGQNSDNYDLFVNGANGQYYFDTVQAFQQGIAQTVSYTNATTGNPNDAAAKFAYQTYTIGLQDDWKISRQLTVSYGLRYDLFGGSSTPFRNQFFDAREGFPNTYFINGKQLLQPRVGIDYNPAPRLNIHGGGGIFGGGTPDVYVGNSFSASGVQPATVTQNTSALCRANLTNVSLTTPPAGCVTALGNASATSTGNTSAISNNFKIPSLWRATLSATYKADFGRLGDGWTFGADVLYSKTRNAIFITDGRDRAITGASALTPDGRQRYYDVVSTLAQKGTLNCVVNTTTCADTGGDYILGDTHKGQSWVLVARMDKKWDFGLDLNASFTYQDAKDQQALTSSVASSNYNNGAYYDPNGGAYGHSNDEVRYTIKYELSYNHAFFGDYMTKFDLFGQTRIGSPYSYTFSDPTCCGSSRSSVFGTVGTNSHYLFYVPTGPNDPLVSYGGTAAQAAATQAAVEALIDSTDLKKYRGKVAPRNAFNSKWFTKIDLHFEQEIPTFVGHSRISVFADVENFLNVLNHNWGQTLRSSFPYDKSVVQVACKAVGSNSCGQYVYTNATSTTNLADQLITYPSTSLYTIRIGARLTF